VRAVTGDAHRPRNHRSPHATYFQAAGAGSDSFIGFAQGDADKVRRRRDGLLKYVQAFACRPPHTAISNAQSRMDVRLARWR